MNQDFKKINWNSKINKKLLNNNQKVFVRTNIFKIKIDNYVRLFKKLKCFDKLKFGIGSWFWFSGKTFSIYPILQQFENFKVSVILASQRIFQVRV